jgi:type II secretory pathway pseudopilin PulG
MALLPKSKLWRTIMIVFGCFIFLAAFFYAEEDLRGWLAWENCKHELAAKGEVLDWDKYIPPPVPDEQNFFKAPMMTEWFVRSTQTKSTNTNGFSVQLNNKDTIATNLNETASAKYLAWSDQFEPQFDLLREALKRPYARIDGDYSIPYQIPIPNWVTVRIVAQTLAQRAKCDLLLGQPDKALQELTLLHDMRHLLEAAPTGKPMTLVAAMINVAVTGLYVDTIADGLQSHTWQDTQVAALQKQLADINLTPFVLQALQQEPAAVCRDAEIMPLYKFMNFGGNPKWPEKIFSWLWPRGWTYQNMVNVAVIELTPLDGFDLAHDTIAPRKFDEAIREDNKFFRHNSPYKILAAIATPNFVRAEQTAAHNQTMVNEAQIACALERYRLATGQCPDTLDALAPQFIETIPHDIIGGDSLIYRPTIGGKFLLYSVGWNETDDGGEETSAKTQYGSPDYTKGDWVWKN